MSPTNLPTRHTGAPRPGPLGQHDGDSLHQSPRWSQVTFLSQVGSSPPIMGTEQTPLTKSSSCAGQTEPRGRYAAHRHCVSRRMEITPPDSLNDLVSLQSGRGGPLRLRRQLSLPNLFFQTARCPVFASEMLTCTPSPQLPCCLRLPSNAQSF